MKTTITSYGKALSERPRAAKVGLALALALVAATAVLAIISGYGLGPAYAAEISQTSGHVWAWGDNHSGQLGDGTTTDSTIPIPVSGLSGVTAVEAGAWHSLALKTDGTVWGSGENFYGEGDGTTTERHAPVRVSGLSGVMDISSGYVHGLALSTMAPIYCKRGQVVCRGTETTDYILGTPYQDTIKAGSGLDWIRAEGANDSVYGGDDHDVIDGSEGKDRLYGGNGNDTIDTGLVRRSPDGDSDYVDCGAGRDTVYREKGTDTIKDCEVVRNR